MAQNKKTETKSTIENLLKTSVAISSCALLFACGGDSGSSGAPEKVELVLSVDELGECSEDFEGDTVFVKDKKTDYICLDGEWTNADSLDSQIRENAEDGSSSSAQNNREESSNSMDKTSSSSNDKDASSSVESSSSSVKDESNSSSSSKYEQDSTAFVQPDIVAIKDKSISGVAQKGPFVTGSTIKLYELDGKTYASTGKSFPGKIASDDGKFNVSSINLASQYVFLEVTGYFRDEITGRSGGPITLNALTDLSDRKNVNINLLSHLEYERVLHLMKTGINISAAKKQAETEILNAFGISVDFARSEDLDIFSKGNDNAALLAISILMLGESKMAELTERLTKFATDIEKDGSWDDEETKAKIADWAQANDYRLNDFRENIEKWKLGTVPDYEKYVRNFWYTNYGIGSCDKTREGEVIATKNERSSTYGTRDRFICRDGAWGDASDLEKDFYKANKETGDDGELWTGPISENIYKYDEAQKKWLWTTENDIMLGLKGCTTNRMGEVGKSSYSNKHYICRKNDWGDGDWVEATDFEKDTYKWTPGEDGEIKSGNVTGTKYDYDGKQKKWRVATTVEAALGGCTEVREADVTLNTGKVDDVCYICKSRTWESTECTAVDKQGWAKGVDGELRKGDYSEVFYKYDEAKREWITATWWDKKLELNGCTTNRKGEFVRSPADNTYYMCEDTTCIDARTTLFYKCQDWVKPMGVEYDTYGETCSAADVGKRISGVVTSAKYYCTENGWVNLSAMSTMDIPKEAFLNPEVTYGSMTDSRDNKVYKTVKIGNQVWMAENLNYADSSATPGLKGNNWCYYDYDSKTEKCDLMGRLYTWTAAMNGICPDGWHLPTYADWESLYSEVNGQSDYGNALRSQVGWDDDDVRLDAYGFTALPAGYYDVYDGVDGWGCSTYFWSATEKNSDRAYTMGLGALDPEWGNIGLGNADKRLGLSIRCIQD